MITFFSHRNSWNFSQLYYCVWKSAKGKVVTALNWQNFMDLKAGARCICSKVCIKITELQHQLFVQGLWRESLTQCVDMIQDIHWSVSLTHHKIFSHEKHSCFLFLVFKVSHVQWSEWPRWPVDCDQWSSPWHSWSRTELVAVYQHLCTPALQQTQPTQVATPPALLRSSRIPGSTPRQYSTHHLRLSSTVIPIYCVLNSSYSNTSCSVQALRHVMDRWRNL